VEPLLDTGRSGPPTTTGRSSRSTGSLESESNDGSNLDEDDDAWENLNEGLDYDDGEDDIRTDENHPDNPPFLPPPEEGDGDADENDAIDDDIHVTLDLKAAIDGVKWKFRVVTPEDTLTPDVEPNGTKCCLAGRYFVSVAA
jgi:hypothetical protein